METWLDVPSFYMHRMATPLYYITMEPLKGHGDGNKYENYIQYLCFGFPPRETFFKVS